MKIISIIPNLPPTIDGLGDYALALAGVMRDDCHLDTQLIVGNHRWQGPRQINGYAIDRVDRRSQRELLKIFSRICDEQAGNIVVFLNLAIYGYARWGTPFWLVSALESWKAIAPNVRIVTMFHELSNPASVPWRHMFWTARAQTEVLQRLLSASDAVITSNARYADVLRQLALHPIAPIELMPVLSNVGETTQPKPLQARRRRLVVFGQCGSRMKAYQNGQSQIQQICKDLGVNEILDLGPTIALPYDAVGDIPIQVMGERSAAAVSAIMGDSIAGFIHYDSRLLAKSGVFAAYCAHGMLPVVSSTDRHKHDDLVMDCHYFVPDDTQIAAMTIDVGQSIAQQAHHWYSKHDLNAQGALFTSILTIARRQ